MCNALKKSLLVIFFLLVFPGLNAYASRKDTLNTLAKLPNNWPSNNIEATVNGLISADIVSGEKLIYSVESLEPGYLLLIHVNSHGESKVVYHSDTEHWLVESQNPVVFPMSGDSLILRAPVAPLGTETLFAVLTDLPIFESEGTTDYVIKKYALDDLELLIDNLQDQVNQGGLVGYSKLSYRIAATAGETEFKTRFVESYFSEQIESTHATKAKSLPGSDPLVSHIQFDVNSVELTLSGKRNLDVIGDALIGDKLAKANFSITGHTDDSGDAAYNMQLSGLRAKEVLSYLIESFGVEESRLEVHSAGETSPLVPNINALNRSKNRRVEFAYVKN